MTEQLTALTVARFLQENPDFFTDHPELFSALTVPHPNQSRAISLGERQILTLRDRQKDLEQRLATLSHQASFNQGISDKLNRWCADLLACDDSQALADLITQGITETFDIPLVALRVWGVAVSSEAVQAGVTAELVAFAESLSTPYCGPNKDFSVAAWFDTQPASMAMMALKTPAGQTLGLLALGSQDKDRFTADMGTTFLQTIAWLAGAALSRLPAKPLVHG
jgi:uncharacterized protein